MVVMCNSRPITVNSILAKLMTRLITIRLTQIVERENILQDSQFGFRANRSTQEAVIILNTVITQHKLDLRVNVDKLKSDKLRRNLFICFIDLEKERMINLIWKEQYVFLYVCMYECYGWWLNYLFELFIFLDSINL